MDVKTTPAQFGTEVLEVPRSFDKYDILREIGLGGFSVVYLVRNRVTSEEYACKVVSRQFLVDSRTFFRFEQEARLLEQLKHPNIIQLIETIYHPTFIFLIMEFCRCGDLCEYIDSHTCLDNHTARYIFLHLVSALAYLHERGVVHRDLKPENIFIDESHSPKLADLGLCHTVTKNQLLQTPCGTAFYAAPEVLTGNPYDGKCTDVWSLGVCLYVMLTGCMPWTSTNFPELQDEIRRGEIEMPDFLGAECQRLLRSMLDVDPDKRPTMKKLVDHPWLAEFTPQPIKLRKSPMSQSPKSSERSLGRHKGSMPTRSCCLPSLLDGHAEKGTRLTRETSPASGSGSLNLLIRRVPRGATRSYRMLDQSPVGRMIDLMGSEAKLGKGGAHV
jgi:serine/threonine protein kinase